MTVGRGGMAGWWGRSISSSRRGCHQRAPAGDYGVCSVAEDEQTLYSAVLRCATGVQSGGVSLQSPSAVGCCSGSRSRSRATKER